MIYRNVGTRLTCYEALQLEDKPTFRRIVRRGGRGYA